MAIPAHSKKLPKWHFLTPALNLKFFWAICLHLKCYESAILWFYPKFVAGSVQVLIQVDKSRDLTSILTKYQYTYQVSVYWYWYFLFWFSNTDTDTSYFKNVLKYWYFSIIFIVSISIFLNFFNDLVTMFEATKIVLMHFYWSCVVKYANIGYIWTLDCVFHNKTHKSLIFWG